MLYIHIIQNLAKQVSHQGICIDHDKNSLSNYYCGERETIKSMHVKALKKQRQDTFLLRFSTKLCWYFYYIIHNNFQKV